MGIQEGSLERLIKPTYQRELINHSRIIMTLILIQRGLLTPITGKKKA